MDTSRFVRRHHRCIFLSLIFLSAYFIRGIATPSLGPLLFVKGNQQRKDMAKKSTGKKIVNRLRILADHFLPQMFYLIRVSSVFRPWLNSILAICR